MLCGAGEYVTVNKVLMIHCMIVARRHLMAPMHTPLVRQRHPFVFNTSSQALRLPTTANAITGLRM